MPDTLVIQSHRSPLPWPWIAQCLESVRSWCSKNAYEYRFIGDELFHLVPASILERAGGQTVIATDLARLLVLRDALAERYETVVWMDADFLIFNPAEFVVCAEPCAVGREVWVQHDAQGRLKAYKKVHNALLMFRKSSSFLDFYIDTAQRLMSLNQGPVPPQFIGPKLLTALHNVARLPVQENAGMLSPLVIKDLLAGEGAALDLFIKRSPRPLAAANLCVSSCERNEISGKQMEALIDKIGAVGFA